MTTFIKFSNMIINKTNIVKIFKYDDNYRIYLKCNDFSGFNTVIGGFISANNQVIEIYKKDKEDYKVIEDWIDKL